MYTSSKPLGEGELVRRILRLEEAIKEFGGEWFAFTSLLHKTDLPKSTLHRQLTILVEEGKLERGHTPLLSRAYREVPKEGTQTLEEKIEALRSWLRSHGDYHITLDLWDAFGTVGLRIHHHSTHLKTFLGKHFEKRLDEALAYIRTIEEKER